MKFKHPSVTVLVFISLIMISMMSGCEAVEKEIFISKDVAGDIKEEENEKQMYVNEGNKYFEAKKYSEARNSYEAALEKDKNDLNLYISIKDKFISVKRYDDAYFFIKLAITNNVDMENMNATLNSIRDMMETTTINVEKYENDDSYSFPTEVEINVDGNIVKDTVIWEAGAVPADSKGSYSYKGITKDYGRNVIANLKVKENVYYSKIGLVRDIYIQDNVTYIILDEVEFYTGKEALEEAKKDGKAAMLEDGTYVVYNGYYIRNTNEDTVTYTAADNVSLNLLAFEVIPGNYNNDPTSVNYDTLKAHIQRWTNQDTDRPLLFTVDFKNDIVTEINRKFTP